MEKFKRYLLFGIVILAFILRFYRLDSYPAINADEAAIGYNAYSLIQTGKDEHDNPWPIHFQSFNDYKPGLYFYIILPFVKLFGLNDWVVRSPAAFLGVLTVPVLYGLILELTKKKNLALTSAFFLAISPWHIHFSRGGWEVNVATFFIVTGVWLFLKGFKNSKFYYLSVISFVLALYTYHAARVIVPFLCLGLFAIYFSDIKRNFSKILFAGIFGIILLLPLARELIGGGATSRLAGVGLFADPGPRSRIEEQRGEHDNFSSIAPKLLHNKAVNYGLAFLENWGKHFHGEFLFLSGDEIQRNRVPETGQMYLFDMVFVGVGILVLIRNFKKEDKLIIWWLVVSPVAAALTFQAPHALRAQNMIIPLVVISAAGLVALIELIKNVLSYKNLAKVTYVLIAVAIAWNFGRYLHMYWVHMAKEYTFSSQYGLRELVDYVQKNQDKYQKVLVTDRYDQPYILFLYYLKYSPSEFQKIHTLTPRDGFGFSTVNHFDKYYFTSIKFDQARPENPNSLIIGTDEEIPEEANIIKEIYGPNGRPVFQIVGN